MRSMRGEKRQKKVAQSIARSQPLKAVFRAPSWGHTFESALLAKDRKSMAANEWRDKLRVQSASTQEGIKFCGAERNVFSFLCPFCGSTLFFRPCLTIPTTTFRFSLPACSVLLTSKPMAPTRRLLEKSFAMSS